MNCRLTTPLTTDRLLLREITLEDRAFLGTMLMNPQVMAFWPEPLNEKGVLEWLLRQLERYEVEGCGYWLAEQRRSGEPIGQAGLCYCEVAGVREVGLGYMFLDSVWGQGYATEAASASLAWGQRMLGYDRILALVRPENVRSARVAERIGLTLEKQVDYAGFRHDVYASTSSPS